jgi:hypothetical protein
MNVALLCNVARGVRMVLVRITFYPEDRSDTFLWNVHLRTTQHYITEDGNIHCKAIARQLRDKQVYAVTEKHTEIS